MKLKHVLYIQRFILEVFGFGLYSSVLPSFYWNYVKVFFQILSKNRGCHMLYIYFKVLGGKFVILGYINEIDLTITLLQCHHISIKLNSIAGSSFHFSTVSHTGNTHASSWVGLGFNTVRTHSRHDVREGGERGVCPAGLQATICLTLMEINTWTGLCLCEANYVWEVRREWEGWTNHWPNPCVHVTARKGGRKFYLEVYGI